MYEYKTGLVGLTNEHKIDVKLAFLKAATSHAFIKAIRSSTIKYDAYNLLLPSVSV